MKRNKEFLLLAFMLASCTVGPDYKRPQFFSDEELSAALKLSGREQTINKDWYKQFNDPILNSLIARGLADSPSIAVARQKLLQARQTLRINAVQNLPLFNAAGAYNKNHVSKNYSQIQTSDDYYQAGLDAAWELDIWGGGRRLTESSWAMVKAAAADFDNVKLTLAAEIASDYLNLRQAQEQLRIARRNLRLQTDMLKLVRQKHAVGLADDVALGQSEYLVAATRQQVPLLQTQVKSYKNALTVLCGKLSGNLDYDLSNVAGNLVRRHFAYDLQQLYDLPLDVLRRRPDIRVLENQLIAQNAKIGQAIAQMFPNVSLSGFAGYRSKNSGNLFGSNSSMYSFAPSVNLPLFHWGAIYNNVELQKSLTEEQLQQYKAGLLEASAEVSDAVYSLQKEYLHNQSATAAVAAQEQVAALTMRKYQEGLIEFSDVLTSQQNLLDAQNTAIAANAAIYQKIIAFYKAIGGGYGGLSEPLRPKVRVAAI